MAPEQLAPGCRAGMFCAALGAQLLPGAGDYLTLALHSSKSSSSSSRLLTGARWGGCSWVVVLGQGGSAGAHPPPGRELRAKCKLWWVKEQKHAKGLSSGGVLQGRAGSFIWRGEVPLGQG